MSQQKVSVIAKISSSLSTAFLTAEFIVNGNCQAQLGKSSQWHLHANPSFNINMLGHTVVG